MNISKADAVAQLGKWYADGTQVRATYKTVTGNSAMIGQIKELDAAQIKLAGNGCEMTFHFRMTSEYEYTDFREAASESHKKRANKYPTIIDVKFSTGDHLEILEFFGD